ncbi:hypothetical protein ACIA5C_19865 [Actinoplanes sp. NPDC051343]|uniref:hypothetical protein n=1 Tax=Actinoplanes sp. NPDC051343 TaxID=3363906 RepID=UPI0037A25146
MDQNSPPPSAEDQIQAARRLLRSHRHLFSLHYDKSLMRKETPKSFGSGDDEMVYLYGRILFLLTLAETTYSSNHILISQMQVDGSKLDIVMDAINQLDSAGLAIADAEKRRVKLVEKEKEELRAIFKVQDASQYLPSSNPGPLLVVPQSVLFYDDDSAEALFEDAPPAEFSGESHQLLGRTGRLSRWRAFIAVMRASLRRRSVEPARSRDSMVDEATDDLNAILNLLGPPPESSASPASTPDVPVGAA